MANKKIAFGFGIVIIEDKCWIAKKERIATASEGGKMHVKEGYFILDGLPKNGFDSASLALEYLSQLSEEMM